MVACGILRCCVEGKDGSGIPVPPDMPLEPSNDDESSGRRRYVWGVFKLVGVGVAMDGDGIPPPPLEDTVAGVVVGEAVAGSGVVVVVDAAAAAAAAEEDVVLLAVIGDDTRPFSSVGNSCRSFCTS